jgi:hypothetical protein
MKEEALKRVGEEQKRADKEQKEKEEALKEKEEALKEKEAALKRAYKAEETIKQLRQELDLKAEGSGSARV